ncbi:MAG: KH domain-containing protein [Fimbriimonadaceae bacterium]|nr:KH domain-containing protein [Fimbriimonadaceae bacterium]QYK56069.1 MAG: KH domain-containing protein [Fimbriimonadaceae bacterium]
MNSIEVAGSTLEDAVGKAAAELGVDRAKVKAEVLDETKGLFGRGQVRIRATVAEEEEAAPKRKRTSTRAKKEESSTAAVAVAEPPAAVEDAEIEPEEVEEAGDAAEDVVASQQDADKLVGYLAELVELSNLDVDATVAELNGKYIHVKLKGRDTSYLVGRRGEVLNALQYIMNVISARQLGNGVRVVLDGDDFRERRAEVLTRQAMDIAEQVRDRGEEAVLDALPAFERRVIHQALSDFAGVTTYSEGEEPNRRVVIAPAE